MLTEKEKEFLNILCKYNTVLEAVRSDELRVKQGTAYTQVYRIRKKAQKWRIGTNQIMGYRKKSPLLDKVLAPKTTKENFN